MKYIIKLMLLINIFHVTVRKFKIVYGLHCVRSVFMAELSLVVWTVRFTKGTACLGLANTRHLFIYMVLNWHGTKETFLLFSSFR